MIWSNPLVVHSLIGVLLGVGFVVPALWWLAVVGVALQIHAVVSQMGLWWHVFYAWTIQYALTLAWFWSVYPIDWLGLDPGAWQLLAIGGYWLSAAVWLGLGGLVLVGVVSVARVVAPQWYVFFLPPAWLLAELAGAYAFSLMTYGPGATIGTQFSFGFLGYHLAQHGALVYVAAVAGVYGLTLIIVAIGLLVYILVRDTHYQLLGVMIGLLVLTHWTAGWLVSELAPEQTDTTTIAVVMTAFDLTTWTTPETRQDREQALQSAYRAARSTDADYILFPEDSRFIPQTTGDFMIAATLGQTQAQVIDTARVSTEEGTVLQAIVVDGDKQTYQYAHKQYLVPQGEYLPTLYAWVLSRVGLTEFVTRNQQTIAYTAGPLASQTRLASDTPGILFCFEGVDPMAVHRLQRERTDLPFVFHPISHAWFNEPVTLWPQLETMLRVQAIWSGVHIVSAANLAESHMYTPTGSVVTPTEIASGEDWSTGLVRLPVK